METSDLIALISFSTATYFAVKSHLLTKHIAKAQGIFKNGNIDFWVYNQNYDGQIGFPELLIISGPIQKNKVMNFPMLFKIANTGDATVEDLDIIIRYNKHLRIIPEKYLTTSGFNESNMNYFLVDEENSQLASINYNKINPSIALNINEQIMFNSPTLIDGNVDVVTKDKKNINISFKTYFSSHIDITISQKNEQPISKRINVMLIDTSNSSLENQLETYNNSFKEEKTSFLKSIKKILFPINKNKNVHLIQFTEEDFSDKSTNDMIYISSSNLKITHGVEINNRLILAYSNKTLERNSLP